VPTKENKLPFSVSVCNKQTEVSSFCFLFAAKKQKLPFSVSSVLRICIYTYTDNENRSLGNFPHSVYHLLILQRKFVVGPFVDEETKENYPFVNGLNGLNGLAHP
jgi:hypothetical protein